ncbi:unnamed protein product, partial [Timema podura]|nr:unnamed protein product [Timema podura]
MLLLYLHHSLHLENNCTACLRRRSDWQSYLSDHELFMDIHYYARDMKEHDLALAAKEKARNILSQCSSASSCETGKTCRAPSMVWSRSSPISGLGFQL